jgi:hypothetical protein
MRAILSIGEINGLQKCCDFFIMTSRFQIIILTFSINIYFVIWCIDKFWWNSLILKWYEFKLVTEKSEMIRKTPTVFWVENELNMKFVRKKQAFV